MSISHKHYSFAILLVVLVVVGCTSQASQERASLPSDDAGAELLSTQIEPKRISEECVELQPHQMLVFSFRTSRPVDFNLHYHEGDEVFYPILEENIDTMAGTFVYHNEKEHPNEKPQTFCLMWKNPRRVDVMLEYEYSIRDE